jgi:hypothetical protein
MDSTLDWELCAYDTCETLSKNEALVFSGSHQIHWRPPINFSENDYFDLIGKYELSEMKTDLMNRFPDQKSYTLFQSPNFKVRIGNFLKKEDAEKYRNQISKFFPKGIYIVEDTIEYTPPEEEQN